MRSCKRCGADIPHTPKTFIKSWEIKGRKPQKGEAKTITISILECPNCGKRSRYGEVKKED